MSSVFTAVGGNAIRVSFVEILQKILGSFAYTGKGVLLGFMLFRTALGL
jgi:hypothetical protein